MIDALAEVLATLTRESDVAWWRRTVERYPLRIIGSDVAWRPSTQWSTLRPLASVPAITEARRIGNAIVRVEVEPERPQTPADALRLLAETDPPLWPWEPGEASAPAWWCEVCSCGSPSCAAGVMDTPPSHAALVSVARLGADRLRAIEELTRVLRDHAGCAGARLVFRVMTRAEIRDHHERISLLSYAHAGDLATMPMSDMLCVAASRSAWSGESSGGLPALRDLHALGVHLIALDERRIVLAVEEIGG